MTRPAIRELLKAHLEDDYQVTEADSGAALQKAFAQEQPDVVLLDVKLPDANGLDLLPSIKKRWPETEVIVLTGAPDDNEAVSWAVEATKRGAFNFLRKQGDRFDREKFLADVKNAVEHKQQNEEASALAPRPRNHERRHLARSSKAPPCAMSSARSSASPPATSPSSSPARAAPARKSSPT